MDRQSPRGISRLPRVLLALAAVLALGLATGCAVLYGTGQATAGPEQAKLGPQTEEQARARNGKQGGHWTTRVLKDRTAEAPRGPARPTLTGWGTGTTAPRKSLRSRRGGATLDNCVLVTDASEGTRETECFAPCPAGEVPIGGGWEIFLVEGEEDAIIALESRAGAASGGGTPGWMVRIAEVRENSGYAVKVHVNCTKNRVRDRC